MVSQGDSVAYFATTARAWEFGAGALVAIQIKFFQKNKARRRASKNTASVALAWAAWLTLVAYLALFKSEWGFPGLGALLPCVATVAIIYANQPKRAKVLNALLRFRPIQFLGNISYSVYLWHWPLLIAAPYFFIFADNAGWFTFAKSWPFMSAKLYAVTFGANTTQIDGLSVIKLGAIGLFVILLGWLSAKFIEAPARFSKTARRMKSWQVMVAAALTMLLIATPAYGVQQEQKSIIAAQRKAAAEFEAKHEAAIQAAMNPVWDETTCMGSAAVVQPECAGFTWSGMIPAIGVEEQGAKNIKPIWKGQNRAGCLAFTTHYEPVHCIFGKLGGTKIALVGDSHSYHWLPAFNKIASIDDIELHIFSRSSCPLNFAKKVGAATAITGCQSWAHAVVDELNKIPNLRMIISADFAHAPVQATAEMSAIEAKIDGYQKVWKALEPSGAEIVVLKDTPFFQNIGYGCLIANAKNPQSCSMPESVVLQNPSDSEVAAKKNGMKILDMTKYICFENECPGVIGGIRVYRDPDHMTGTFNLLLAPYLLRELKTLSPIF